MWLAGGMGTATTTTGLLQPFTWVKDDDDRRTDDRRTSTTAEGRRRHMDDYRSRCDGYLYVKKEDNGNK